jgi:hypothetical protein
MCAARPRAALGTGLVAARLNSLHELRWCVCAYVIPRHSDDGRTIARQCIHVCFTTHARFIDVVTLSGTLPVCYTRHACFALWLCQVHTSACPCVKACVTVLLLFTGLLCNVFCLLGALLHDEAAAAAAASTMQVTPCSSEYQR